MNLPVALLALSVVASFLTANGNTFLKSSKISSHGNFTYTFYNSSYEKFEEAKTACEKNNGSLVFIKTNKTQIFIQNEIKEFMSYEGNAFNDGFWIGLKLVGAKWKWSDGTNSEYQKWYDTETESNGENCAAIQTKNIRYKPHYPVIFGYWGNHMCNNKNKFICQNEFGTGFLSQLILEVNSDSQNVTCLVVGDEKHYATWTRNDAIISSVPTETIFQIYAFHTSYSTSTIVFKNPYQADEGAYTCLLVTKTSAGNRTEVKRLSLMVKIRNFNDPMKLTPVDKLNLSQTKIITCSIRSRPPSNLTWKINNKLVEEDENVFVIRTETHQLTTTSTFTLINPISFQANTEISCWSNVKTDSYKKILINSDFYQFTGYSYKLNLSKSSKYCARFNTTKDSFNSKECYIKAADLQQKETGTKYCIGKTAVFTILDYTYSPSNFNLTVNDLNDLNWNQTIFTTKNEIQLTDLKPNHKYNISLRYRPKYWKTLLVLTKIFQTEVDPFDVIIVTKAVIKEKSCEFQYLLPKNIEKKQIESIHVNISAINKSHSFNYTIKDKYNFTETPKENFSFEVDRYNADNFNYSFQVSLQSCNGLYGVKSEQFLCQQILPKIQPASNIGIIIGIVCVCIILIVIVGGFIAWKTKKRHKTKEFVEEKQSNVYMDLAENVVSVPWSGILKNNLLEKFKKMTENKNQLFISQFKTLKIESAKVQSSFDEGSSEKNHSKNRYKNIIPYDITRVVLKDVDEKNSDYINASWIKNSETKRVFIAAQGPMSSTVNDFWKMIFVTDSKVIVMLTNLFERGKKKCEQYWPSTDQSVISKQLKVSFVYEKEFDSYIRRTFLLESKLADNTVSKRTITQFHFTCWPDHGVPLNTSQILRFYKDVIQLVEEDQNNSPVVVHCSAGVGRTGTFIALDHLTFFLKSHDFIDIYQTVFDLRKQRMNMVQTVDQFVFLHKLAMEEHISPNTDYSSEEFSRFVSTNQKFDDEIADEFSRLDKLSNVASVTECSTISQRLRNGRCILSVEEPNTSTAEDFFQLLIDYSVSLIITIDDNNSCCPYWREDQSFKTYGKFMIADIKSVPQDAFTIGTICLKESTNERIIKQIVVDSWVKDDPKKVSHSLNFLIQEVYSLWFENSTILVHCSNESSDSGVICTLLKINERFKLENKVDVFRTVKDLRDIRPNTVTSLDDYRICYYASNIIAESLQTYANFH